MIIKKLVLGFTLDVYTINLVDGYGKELAFSRNAALRMIVQRFFFESWGNIN